MVFSSVFFSISAHNLGHKFNHFALFLHIQFPVAMNLEAVRFSRMHHKLLLSIWRSEKCRFHLKYYISSYNVTRSVNIMLHCNARCKIIYASINLIFPYVLHYNNGIALSTIKFFYDLEKK